MEDTLIKEQNNRVWGTRAVEGKRVNESNDQGHY